MFAYIFNFVFKILRIVAILHEHYYVLLIFKIIVELNNVFVFEHALNHAFLVRLPQLVFTKKFVLLDDFFYDVLYYHNMFKSMSFLPFNHLSYHALM